MNTDLNSPVTASSPVRLFELKRNSHFRLDGERYFFDHVDGMYSYCKDNSGNVVHIAAYTEVEPE